jgi:hypothetical protein
MEKNNWLLIPKLGISLGGIRITFEDQYFDVIKKLNLEKTHGITDLSGFGLILDNILSTRASIRFQFIDSLFNIEFFGGNLFFEDLNLLNSDIRIVITTLISKGYKLLYDDAVPAYISEELGIYFCSSENVGGDGTDVCYVGISSLGWGESKFIEEVTAYQHFDLGIE